MYFSIEEHANTEVEMEQLCYLFTLFLDFSSGLNILNLFKE